MSKSVLVTVVIHPRLITQFVKWYLRLPPQRPYRIFVREKR